MTIKPPTCVLFKPNKEFHSFGYAAEEAYYELELKSEHTDWYFFKRFKKILYEKNIHRTTEIEDVKGLKAPAIQVFATVIRFLKDHFLNNFSRILPVNKQPCFALLVPAVCSDSAKQFLREAGYEAGIDWKHLTIVSKPVAAAIFSQVVPVDSMLGNKEWLRSADAKSELANRHSKHMVVDIGEEKTCITVLEHSVIGQSHEICYVDYNPWGKSTVRDNFYQILIAFVGAPIFKRYFDENKPDLWDLQRGLEHKHRCMPASTGLKMPARLFQMYEDEMGETIKVAINNSPYSGKVKLTGDKILIEQDLSTQLYKLCTDKIAKHIIDSLQKPAVQGTATFVITGNFSDCEVVRESIIHSIRSELPNSTFIVPMDPELAALQGAVICGHREMAI